MNNNNLRVNYAHTSMLSIGHQGCRRLLLLQFIITLLMSVAFLFTGVVSNGLSALLAGMIVVVTNWYFSRQFFAQGGARAAKEIFRRILWAELIKILLSILLFTLAFKFLHAKMLPFFVSYIIVQSMFWFSPLLFK